MQLFHPQQFHVNLMVEFDNPSPPSFALQRTEVLLLRTQFFSFFLRQASISIEHVLGELFVLGVFTVLVVYV